MNIAIVDFGMGNIFSVMQACRIAGFETEATNNAEDIASADALILPGVGAFGDAMESLRRNNLIDPMRAHVREGKPLMGVCLGMQLLFDSSSEFGETEGLGIIPGQVVRLTRGGGGRPEKNRLKIPSVGWFRVHMPEHNPTAWQSTPMQKIRNGEYFYFVHSFIARPDRQNHGLAFTKFSDQPFASAVRCGAVTGFQFHPERSGPAGIHIYRSFGSTVGDGDRI